MHDLRFFEKHINTGFEPWGSFVVPERFSYVSDEKFERDVLGDPINPPIGDFLPDVMFCDSQTIQFKRMYSEHMRVGADESVDPRSVEVQSTSLFAKAVSRMTAAHAYMAAVQATRYALAGNNLAVTTETLEAVKTPSFCMKVSWLIAASKPKVWEEIDYTDYIRRFGSMLPNPPSSTYWYMSKMHRYLELNFPQTQLSFHTADLVRRSWLAKCVSSPFNGTLEELRKSVSAMTPASYEVQHLAEQILYWCAREGLLYDANVNVALGEVLEKALPVSAHRMSAKSKIPMVSVASMLVQHMAMVERAQPDIKETVMSEYATILPQYYQRFIAAGNKPEHFDLLLTHAPPASVILENPEQTLAGYTAKCLDSTDDPAFVWGYANSMRDAYCLPNHFDSPDDAACNAAYQTFLALLTTNRPKSNPDV